MEADLQNLTYEELRKLQKEVDAKVIEQTREARTNALKTIVAHIREFDITAEELNAAIRGKTLKARSKGMVAPKYRNPENPDQTWTGRGVAPLWIRDVPKEDRTAFLI